MNKNFFQWTEYIHGSTKNLLHSRNNLFVKIILILILIKQLILQMIAMEINLTIKMTYLPLETRIMNYRNAKLRTSFVICWVAQGSRPRCGPRHPILHSNIFFYVELFTRIILSWNSIKGILWYLLELSDPFIKNKNSVLPILIEKNFERKIHFFLLKMRYIFFKEGKSSFFY